MRDVVFLARKLADIEVRLIVLEKRLAPHTDEAEPAAEMESESALRDAAKVARHISLN